MTSSEVLAAHRALTPVAWRVGATEVPLLSALSLRGHPGHDPALSAVGEALARERLSPPTLPFVDATGGPAAIVALARALHGPIGAALVTSAAARRAVLALTAAAGQSQPALAAAAGESQPALAAAAGESPPALRADHPWDFSPQSVAEAWWRPPSERGWARLVAEAQGWARALLPSGRLVAVWHKDEGAKRAERMAAELFGGVDVVNRSGGWRVVELTRPVPGTAEVQPWLHWPGPDGPMRTLVGTFAADRLDAGTAALLGALDAAGATAELGGARVVDLGCGSGVLARRALAAGAAEVLAIDDDLSAVRSTQAVLGSDAAARTCWSDLTLDAPEANGFDVVLTNPPFHVGRQAVAALSEGFVAAAHAALRPGGRLWLVANAALPFDRLLARWREARDVTPAGVRAYRVFSAVRR